MGINNQKRKEKKKEINNLGSMRVMLENNTRVKFQPNTAYYLFKEGFI
jgi:hypothetical protein